MRKQRSSFSASTGIENKYISTVFGAIVDFQGNNPFPRHHQDTQKCCSYREQRGAEFNKHLNQEKTQLATQAQSKYLMPFTLMNNIGSSMKHFFHYIRCLFFSIFPSCPTLKKLVKTISVCAIKANHSIILMTEFMSCADNKCQNT